MTSRILPNTITSYDLLKSAALLLMIIDHAGAYFYPDEMWFRAIGRLSAPIWLFLVGYARSRDLSAPLWIWAGIVAVGNFIMGEGVLPLNILFTIAFCRMAVTPLMQGIARSKASLYPILFASLILALPTFLLFEYGTGAMLMVILGYAVRQDFFNEDNKKFQLVQLAVVTAVFYALFQFFIFSDFTAAQRIFVGGGLGILCLALLGFRPRTYEGLTERLGGAGAAVVRFFGRRTLEIYAVHLLLFKALSIWLGLSDQQLFDFHIFR